MARVRMLTDIANRNFAFGYDEEVDIPGELASQWVTAGVAEWAVTATETPERAVRTETRRGPGRPRKNPI